MKAEFCQPKCKSCYTLCELKSLYESIYLEVVVRKKVMFNCIFAMEKCFEVMGCDETLHELSLTVISHLTILVNR